MENKYNCDIYNNSILKKIIVLVLTIILIFSFTACAKVVNEDYEDIEVVIIEASFEEGKKQPVIIGPVVGILKHSDKYNIWIEYNKEIICINCNQIIYNKYKNKVGETIIAELRTRTYDDGTISSRITELK